MDFKVINTQEEFDAAIQQRLERERAKYSDYETLKEKAGKYDTLAAKNYEKTVSDLRGQLEQAQNDLKARDKTVTELTGRAEAAELSQRKVRAAMEYHLPLNLADRLQGSTEAELTKDAEIMSRYLGGSFVPPPGSVPPQTGSADAALLQLATALGN